MDIYSLFYSLICACGEPVVQISASPQESGSLRRHFAKEFPLYTTQQGLETPSIVYKFVLFG